VGNNGLYSTSPTYLSQNIAMKLDLEYYLGLVLCVVVGILILPIYVIARTIVEGCVFIPNVCTQFKKNLEERREKEARHEAIVHPPKF